jgi:hypothetical protein
MNAYKCTSISPFIFIVLCLIKIQWLVLHCLTWLPEQSSLFLNKLHSMFTYLTWMCLSDENCKFGSLVLFKKSKMPFQTMRTCSMLSQTVIKTLTCMSITSWKRVLGYWGTTPHFLKFISKQRHVMSFQLWLCCYPSTSGAGWIYETCVTPFDDGISKTKRLRMYVYSIFNFLFNDE